MAQDLAVIDTTVQKTHIWINEVAQEAGWDDKHKAHLALRAVLPALRDRLTVDEAAHLSAQLPMLVRGIYFEGWRPAEVPHRHRHIDEFLDAVAARYPGTDAEPQRMVDAVFAVLKRMIDAGEIDNVAGIMPQELRGRLVAH